MRGFAVSALCAVAACGEVQNEVRPAVRDSAGPTIAEYSGDFDGLERFHLSGSPVLEIGAMEGMDEVLFSRIVAAFAGTDGTTVVAEAWLGRFVSAPDGRFLGSIAVPDGLRSPTLDRGT